MQRTYRNVGYLFIAVLLVAVAGFWKSYFGLLPGAGGWPVVIHGHALVLLFWFGVLIAQPLLDIFIARAGPSAGPVDWRSVFVDEPFHLVSGA